MPSHALHRYSKLTAAATLLLVIAGGLVTSTDSGLAVPDWPLSYGMWFPPMVGGIFYEHGHRMIAGAVGIMIFVQGLWIARTQVPRWVKRLSLAAVIAVIVQALLGGATVLLLLPAPISIAHACLGQTLWCLTVCLEVATAPKYFKGGQALNSHAGSAANLALACAVLVALQLFLGAIVRHTGHAVMLHITGAACVAFAIVCLSIRLIGGGRDPVSARMAWCLGAGLVTQLILGFSVFFNRASIPWRTFHVVVGAVLLAQAVVLAWYCTRSKRLKINPSSAISMEAV